ncbi:hypothetical protein V2J09_018519 [Rumex salicifolius]
MASALLLLSVVLAVPLLSPKSAEAQNIGVCFGRNGDNLPTAQEVVNLYELNGIYKMRIYSPDQEILRAVKGSHISLIVDVANQDIMSLGSNSSAAAQWVHTNVVPFASNILYIAVGNLVVPGSSDARFMLPAMQNVQKALRAVSLAAHIKIHLQHLILHSNLVTDSGNGLQYQNLFDALVDSFYAALESVGGDGVGIVVSETGWPSQGTDIATSGNAGTYYKNLIGHVAHGTPKKQGQPLETYMFAMFDEDQKYEDEVERYFGLFRPNQHNKYAINSFSDVPILLGSLCFD